ncbi:MAG: sugar ABC transporter substrate-binding protein, partial [Butyrivibrio sp.]|nr:sugar ABC transporter substrate-binding protein [Butyrivibrio sp.]
MKKKVLSMFLASAMALSIVACGSSNGGTTTDTAPAATETAPAAETKTDAPAAEAESAGSSELTDGKFAETRQITVEVYDRGNDGGSDPENNMYTEYIKKGMLEEHNVEVTFKKVGRWTETEDINNLLASQEAPDICVTYSYPTVLTYANMGGVIDLQDLVEQYKADTPNLWNWLGETNMLWDKDPKTGALWAIEGKRAEQQRIVTFVRQDWLDKLNLKAPTTTQEFEDMLVAFRDNADTLLGKDA